jgi:hypothetical protein
MWGLVKITATWNYGGSSYPNMTNGHTYTILWADTTGVIAIDDNGALFNYSGPLGTSTWTNVVVKTPTVAAIQIFP